MTESHPQRHVRFPPDRSLGWVRVRGVGQGEGDDWEEIGEARGEVTVARDGQLRLIVAPAAAADLSPLAGLAPHDIQQLYLGQTKVTDEQLGYVAGLTGLRLLSLSDTDITDRGLAALRGLTRLQTLHLWSCRHITDAGLVHLEQLAGLQKLTLGRTKVSDAGLIHLSRLRTLREVHLDHTRVSDNGRAMLARMLPNIRIVY